MYQKKLPLLAPILVLSAILSPQLIECRPPRQDIIHESEDANYDQASSMPSSTSEDERLIPQDPLNNGMSIDETQAIPVLIEVPEGGSSPIGNGGTNGHDNGQTDQSAEQSDESSDIDESEMAPAESAHYDRHYQNGSPADLKASASHHYHGHGAKGWLDMGAWTGKKGAFGWYDKHPVGGKGK